MLERITLPGNLFVEVVAGLADYRPVPDPFCPLPPRPPWPWPPPPIDRLEFLLTNPSVSPLAPVIGMADVVVSLVLEAPAGAAFSMAEWVDWCGSVPKSELLRQLLKKLKKWPPPPPDPWGLDRLTPVDLVVMGARFQQAATHFAGVAAAGELENAAGKLLDMGISGAVQA